MARGAPVASIAMPLLRRAGAVLPQRAEATGKVPYAASTRPAAPWTDPTGGPDDTLPPTTPTPTTRLSAWLPADPTRTLEGILHPLRVGPLLGEIGIIVLLLQLLPFLLQAVKGR